MSGWRYCPTCGQHHELPDDTPAPTPQPADDLMRDLNERAENDPYHGYLFRAAAERIKELLEKLQTTEELVLQQKAVIDILRTQLETRDWERC